MIDALAWGLFALIFAYPGARRLKDEIFGRDVRGR